MSRIIDAEPCKAIALHAGSGSSSNGSGGSSSDTPAGKAAVGSAGEAEDGGSDVADEGDEANEETIDPDQMDSSDRGWDYWAARSQVRST